MKKYSLVNIAINAERQARESAASQARGINIAEIKQAKPCSIEKVLQTIGKMREIEGPKEKHNNSTYQNIVEIIASIE